MKNRKTLISWIMLIIWMSFIFYMSNQTGEVSSGQSNRVVEILNAIGINFNNTAIDLITFIIRKTAHFAEYFILYLLSYNVTRQYPIRHKKLAALVLLVAYAISDEIHQYFVPGRSMALRDVFIDSMGGIFAMIIIITVQMLINKRKKA